jgi:cystathionine beta-lyase
MPIYPPFINSVVEQGRRIVEHTLIDNGSRFVLDSASLPRVVNARTRVLMLCNPHNPTGRVFERPELEAIANAAVEHDLVVLADEVHADLVYPGRKHVPFASLGSDVAARTITITSATKAYNIPGMRCGLMHFGSSALRERFRARIPDRLLGKVNRFGVQATVVAWREGAAWLQDVMKVLERNRERVHRFVSSELPKVRYYSPEASYLAWLDCRGLELNEPAYQFFLEHARVAMNDGAEFGAPAHVRLNFATSPAILNEILERLTTAVRVER